MFMQDRLRNAATATDPGTGVVHGVDGNRTARLSDGRLSGADLRVWRDLAAYGFERWFCPGHGASRVCPYGAHDYVRMAGGAPVIDLDSL